MKKNRRKKNKGDGGTSPAKGESPVIHFREQLKSESTEGGDAALQLLRQADMVSVIDSKDARAILVVPDKVEVRDDGSLEVIAEIKNVRVVVDDEESDEQAGESDRQIEELRKLFEELKGPCRYYGNLQDADKKPRFMFVCDGIIKGYEFSGLRGPIFARTRKVAEQYVAWIKEHEGVKAVIADIEAVARQSYEALLAESFQNGANSCFVIKMVDRGDVPFGIVPLDSILHEVDGWMVPFADTELPKYMIVHEGHISLWDNGKQRGPILAHTREVAERYVAEMKKRRGIKQSVADIQAVAEMTVKEVLDATVEDGANCAIVIRAVADDGEAKTDFIYPTE